MSKLLKSLLVGTALTCASAAHAPSLGRHRHVRTGRPTPPQQGRAGGWAAGHRAARAAEARIGAAGWPVGGGAP